ncbi:hypothetical protein FB192DRAFT_1437934 [Mucor lusitanicus]|uniref:Galactose oxidase n=1 Tax=Mucor circinelloides f. lusitanicus TaxID=29924 RepID=A0A8H4B684_MUCCL|nr:hypothetical protein FB192DRAFT_1463638 [Mucor lusitanicus]KAF1799541.1 hypothetical protein FB192DRAFT_1437934 [Mucor lusitanicus]
MLRRQPTAVALTAEDIEHFKELLSHLQEQKNKKKERQDAIAVEDCDPDDIFMGKSLLLSERKRRRETEARLGLASEEQQQQAGESSSTYIIQPRFGHSAVLVNDSIYFYGGDSSVSSAIKNTSEWLSELSILPIHSPYSLTDPPWKPASGPQDSIGGPSVYSHIAFMGGTNSGNMIVIGGVMPQTERYTTDEEPTAYSYDCDLGRWNSFSLPSGNHLNRQGAASTPTEHGIAYIWGGKRAVTISSSSPPPPPTTTTTSSNITRPALSASMYRFDSTWPANSTVITPAGLSPPLRYAHTQTLISDHKIVVLGGFDSATGDPIPLSDIWVYDIRLSVWSQINAKLDVEKKPGARSSHSQVLMSDGFSILVYGGYDGYHVYNDVAVLDTRTWTWTVKNTNAAVQGRADHTGNENEKRLGSVHVYWYINMIDKATLVGSNMIVAFGFTGVSTALTVMADIEVLDVITWSWTSVYTPSPGYNTGGIGTRPNGGIGDTNASGNANGPGSPSIAIVAGAVTGGLVVFLLILVAFYLLNNYHQRQRNQTKDGRARGDNDSECSDTSSAYTIAPPPPPAQPQPQPAFRPPPQPIMYPTHGVKSQEMLEIKFRDPPSSTEPFEYCQSTSRRPSNQVPHPLQINTSNLPTRSDTIGTATTVNSSVLLVPSPWTPIQTKPYKEHDQDIIPSPSSTTTFGFNNFNNHAERGDSSSSSDWAIRRAASTPTQHHYQQAPMQSIASNISKPDDRFYPPNALRRAATVSELTKKSSSSSMATLSNSTSAVQRSSSTREPPRQPSHQDDDEDDALFDRQEFILQSDEVAKVEEEQQQQDEEENEEAHPRSI